jgi:hypothetical protein
MSQAESFEYARHTMVTALSIAALVLAAVTMSLALAHALEFPGKRRLDESSYLIVQTIYYPGFTIAGAAEPLSALAALLLFFLLGANGKAAILALTAFVALAAMHIVFWAVTQPTNRFWLRRQQLTPLGRQFFRTQSVPESQAERNVEKKNWKEMRDRWEYSHIARAFLAVIAFAALNAAVLLRS